MPQLGVLLGIDSPLTGAVIDGVLQAEVGAFLQTEDGNFLAFD